MNASNDARCMGDSSDEEDEISAYDDDCDSNTEDEVEVDVTDVRTSVRKELEWDDSTLRM